MSSTNGHGGHVTVEGAVEAVNQIAVQLHCELIAEQAAPAPIADLGRILNPKPAAWARPQRGVIPASQIERAD